MNLDNNTKGSEDLGEDFLVLIIVIVLVIGGVWYNLQQKPSNKKEFLHIEKTPLQDSLHSVEVDY